MARGGTGKASWTANRLMYPSASTTMTQLAFPSVAGSVLRQGTSGAPYWTSLKDLKAAMDLREPVGTMKSTVRTDLGENWVLCTGELIMRADYPDLADVCLPTVGCDRQIVFGTQYPSGVACNGNTWVAVGSGGSKPYAWVSKDSGKTWTGYSVSESTGSISDIIYYNKTWYAIGSLVSNSVPNARLWYTTDPTGTWTQKSLESSYRGSSICCNNGTFVVGLSPYYSNHYPKITTTTTPTGTWTTVQLNKTVNHGLNCVAYHNGTCVAVGEQYVYVATDPAGTWEMQTAPTACYLNDVAYHDGEWAIVGYKNSGKLPHVLTTDNPSGGNWTEITPSQSTALYNSSITYCRGSWVIIGNNSNTNTSGRKPVYLTSTSLTDAWTTTIMPTQFGIGGLTNADDNTWVAVGTVYQASNYDSVPTVLSNAWARLPSTPSSNNYYTYIKARED